MTSVFVAGGASFDTIVRLDAFPSPQPQTLFARGHHEAPGATGVGKAVHLAKLGLRTTLHAFVGADARGERIGAYVRAAGVRFIADVDPLGTERHLNLMDADGGRISIFLTRGTAQPGLDLPALEAELGAADHVVLNIIDYCRRLIPAAKAAGKPVWCDLHDWDGRSDYHRDFVAAADFVFMSSDRLPDPEPRMRELVAGGKRLVVCTHGRRGSTLMTADGLRVDEPAITAYETVDTNGAGDAFMAGYLYGHVRGLPPADCLRLATVAGGLCVTSPDIARADFGEALLLAECERQQGWRPFAADGAHRSA